MSYLRWSSSATKRRNSCAKGTRFDAPLFHHDAPNPNGRVKKFRSLFHFLFPVFDGQSEGGVCLCSSSGQVRGERQQCVCPADQSSRWEAKTVGHGPFSRPSTVDHVVIRSYEPCPIVTNHNSVNVYHSNTASIGSLTQDMQPHQKAWV